MTTAIETAISAVTVFPNGARVTRTGKVTLSAGESTLVIGNLPQSIDTDSVRAGGRGDGVRLLSVEVKTEHLTETPEEEIAALETTLRDLNRQDKFLTDEDWVIAGQVEWLKSLAEQSSVRFARELARKVTGLEEIASLAVYVQEQTSKHLARRAEIATRREDLAREIEAVKRRLQQLRRPQALTRYAIHAAVDAEVGTEFELEAEYNIRDAFWIPLYDVRLAEEGVELTYLAQVTQRSGEDWNEVLLSLSTARPGAGRALPELYPWYIDRLAPPPPPRQAFQKMGPYAGGAPMPMMASAPMEREEVAVDDLAVTGVLADAPAPAPAAQAAVASVEAQSGAAVTYRVPIRADIPSDGTPHKTTVAVERLSADLDYLIVPKLAEEAFLRATITNDSSLILLPGEASVFHNVDFVGKTWLEIVAPRETFEAQMGVDDRVRVKRELVKRDVGKARIGTTRRSEFAYTITIKSHLNKNAAITVKDHLPVSRHENIKSRLTDSSPEPSEQTDLNLLHWTFELEPGGEKKIRYGFSVEHPRDMNITGLGI